LQKAREMKRKHRYITIPGLVIVLCVVALLRLSGKNARAEQRGVGNLRPVAVALVERKPIVNSLTLSGEFRPFQVVDVHAKVAGYIREISVDVGDKVKEGQVMAILEVPELSAQVVAAEAARKRSQDAIRRAQSDVERAKSAHAAAHSAYARLKQASTARPGLIAEQELDDALAKDKEGEAQVDSAVAALAEAQSQLSIEEAECKRLQAMESYTRITAPFAGVLTKRYADTGSLIQAGTASNTQAMPVVQLAEWSKLRLVVPVPESAVPSIHLGTAVQVKVPDLKRTFEGRVARFADAVTDETRTMHTEIDVDNLDGTLIGGMYAETALVLDQKDGVLTVPIQAVQRNGSQASVLTVDSAGRIEERQITLGEEGSNQIEVVTGLKENDQVVIGNRGEFRAGETVQPKVIADSEEAQP
jgi:RND family efflux transporter MFP subunit